MGCRDLIGQPLPGQRWKEMREPNGRQTGVEKKKKNKSRETGQLYIMLNCAMMASMPTSATAAGRRRPVLIFYFSLYVAQLSSSLRDSLYPLILFGTASMGLRGSLWCPSSAPPVSLQPST